MEFVIAFVSFMAGPLLVGLGLTLGLEHLLLKQMTTPPAAFWRRPVSARLAHVGYWCASWSLCTLITQRPWFSLIVVNALWLVVLQVSHTKYVSLREPFLSQDFEYFTDAIKHPRLYIPFFGIGLTIAATTAGGGLVAPSRILYIRGAAHATPTGFAATPGIWWRTSRRAKHEGRGVQGDPHL